MTGKSATAPEAGGAIAVMAKSSDAGALETRLVPPLTPAAALPAAYPRDTTEFTQMLT